MCHVTRFRRIHNVFLMVQQTPSYLKKPGTPGTLALKRLAESKKWHVRTRNKPGTNPEHFHGFSAKMFRVLTKPTRNTLFRFALPKKGKCSGFCSGFSGTTRNALFVLRKRNKGGVFRVFRVF